MTDIKRLDITGRHRQQDMILASITRLGNKVEELDAEELSPPIDWLAAKMVQLRLNELDKDFKRYNFTIINLLEPHDELELEQATFNDLEDRVGNLGNCIKQLVM